MNKFNVVAKSPMFSPLGVYKTFEEAMAIVDKYKIYNSEIWVEEEDENEKFVHITIICRKNGEFVQKTY